MNKTLLYVTAAAGLIVASGAALADAGNVEIYGTINSDFENVQANAARSPAAAPGQVGVTGVAAVAAPTGQAQPSRNRVTTNSSNIGFRGKEDLGMGWSAIFQIESQFNLDGADSTKGATTATPVGTFASRNSNVGLSSSKYGVIFYGIWDLPTKVMHNSIDAFYATGIGSGNAIYGSPGFGVVTTTQTGRLAGAGDASFDRRQGNSVQYWSPKLYGISARLAYSANEGRSVETPAAPTFSINPTIYAASLLYEYGPFSAGYTFEQHRDYFGLSALGGTAPSVTNFTARDNENSVVLKYKFDSRLGTTTLGALWERLSYNNSDTTAAGALLHYDRDAYYYSLLHKYGNGTIRASFGDAHSGSCDRAAAACSSNGLDARQYVIGYSYSLSKRTDVYTLWSQTNNGPFAAYQLGNNNNAYSATIPAGARQQAFGLGIRHVF
jgi:predicted porin